MAEEKIHFVAEKILSMNHEFDDSYLDLDSGASIRFDPVSRPSDCDFLLRSLAAMNHGALIIWHNGGRVSCSLDPNGDTSCLAENRGEAVIDSAYKLLTMEKENEHRKRYRVRF